MSFVHCHECSWEQDDFWHWRYNPVRSLLETVKRGLKVVPIHKLIFNTLTQDIPWFFKKLWKQYWWTRTAFIMSDKKCPKCRNHLCED